MGGISYISLSNKYSLFSLIKADDFCIQNFTLQLSLLIIRILES